MDDPNRGAFRNPKRPREEIIHRIPTTSTNSRYRSNSPPPWPEFYQQPNSNSIYRTGPPPPAEFDPRPNSNSIHRGGPLPPAEFDPRPNSNSIHRGGPPPPAEFDPRPNTNSIHRGGPPPPAGFYPRPNSNSIHRGWPPPPAEFYPQPNSNSIHRGGPPPAECYPRPNSNSIHRGGPPPPAEFYPRPNKIPPAEFYPRPNSNLIHRGGPPPPAEFYPRPNKIRKTSSENFSAELKEGSEREFTEIRSVGQRENDRAINASSNLPTSFEEPVWPNSREISQPMGQPLRSKFEPRINNTYNSSTNTPGPGLRPPQPENDKKPVNWPLACFMAHEYLTRGTLLGKPWPPPPQDSNIGPQGNDSKSKPTSDTEVERPESTREKKPQRSNTGPMGNDNKFKPTSGTEEERPQSVRETEPQDSNTGPRENVSWPLACFMAHEYLTRGTLLGRPWPPPPQESSIGPQGNDSKSKPTSGTEVERPESRREKQPQCSNTGPLGNDNKFKPTSGTEEERPQSVRETEPQDSNTVPRGNVNWPLACLMAHEYLTRGTLLGRPWPPPQDSNPGPSENANKLKLTPCIGEVKPESRREKEPRDSNTRPLRNDSKSKPTPGTEEERPESRSEKESQDSNTEPPRK